MGGNCMGNIVRHIIYGVCVMMFCKEKEIVYANKSEMLRKV